MQFSLIKITLRRWRFFYQVEKKRGRTLITLQRTQNSTQLFPLATLEKMPKNPHGRMPLLHCMRVSANFAFGKLAPKQFACVSCM